MPCVPTVPNHNGSLGIVADWRREGSETPFPCLRALECGLNLQADTIDLLPPTLELLTINERSHPVDAATIDAARARCPRLRVLSAPIENEHQVLRQLADEVGDNSRRFVVCPRHFFADNVVGGLHGMAWNRPTVDAALAGLAPGGGPVTVTAKVEGVGDDTTLDGKTAIRSSMRRGWGAS